MRMNYLKLIQNLKQDLKERLNDFETVKFFRKDIISYWIWFEVLEKYYNNNNNNNNIESIIQNIPNELGSRPTLFKVIDTAVAKNYFIKELDKKDKRKFNLIPSKKTIKEFEEWAIIFKGL
jgi:hypothetical protein